MLFSLMMLRLTESDISSLGDVFKRSGLKPAHPMNHPGWLGAWAETLLDGYELWLRIIESGGTAIGIAPLKVKGDDASLIGDADVCDYLDFTVRPGAESDFFKALVPGLRSSGIKKLELDSLRPDSAAVRYLVPYLNENTIVHNLTQTDVSLDMPLPKDWNTYLASLTAHQRHEVGRKLRRLREAAGEIVFSVEPPQDLNRSFSMLIDLLRRSRQDKAAFMTPERERFFNRLAEEMNRAGYLRFGELAIGGRVLASIMCFDYNNVRYLFNSGYEPNSAGLSVGLLSKALSIKDAIEQGLGRYDFLKGAEVYKYHLGGEEMPIYKLTVELS